MGQGLTAKVYWARMQDGRDFALKVFNWDNPNFSREFFVKIQSEHQLAVGLDHENVVKLHGFREQAMMIKPKKRYQVSYIIQDLIAGGELFDYIENSGSFEQHFVRNIASQILNGVLFMHSKGVAHRDLKSTNILLDSNYTVKIVDLGFAKPVAGDKGTGIMQSLVGTQDHMAPQIHEAQEYRGTEVDLFAVGVILFTLYAGHPPFFEAKQTDEFYKWLYYGQARKFWSRHQQYHPEGFFDPDFMNLMTLMFSYHPSNRPTIADIIAHPWLRRGSIASTDEVREQLLHRDRVNREKLRLMKANSEKARRDLKFSPQDAELSALYLQQFEFATNAL